MMKQSLHDEFGPNRTREAQLERQRRIDQRQEREAQRRLRQRRNYIIGELVTRHFPEIEVLKPGTARENDIIFVPFEKLLLELSEDKELLQELRRRVGVSK